MSFLEFLQEFRITDEIKDNLRLFIWGDSTLDVTGDIKRLSAPQFKKQYPHIIESIQEFFNAIKEPFIRRFLIDGVKSKSSAEFVYYGTVESGICCQSEKKIIF